MQGMTVLPMSLFSSSSTLPQRLESNYVTETCEDGFDRMWVATTSGLELIDMKSLAVEREVPEFVEQTQGDYCNFIATDSLGCLWYTIHNVLYRVAFASDGSVARRDSLVAPAAAVNTRLKFRDIDSDVPCGPLLTETYARSRMPKERDCKLYPCFR